MKHGFLTYGFLRLWALLLLIVASLSIPATAQGVVEVNMNALYEAVGADAMRQVPEAPDAIPQPRPSAAMASTEEGSRTLQIIYGQADLVISPEDRETLTEWTRTYVSPDDRVQILSYSGHRPSSWNEPGLHPGQDIATYSLHESIRTGFKRALVIRDILVEQGVGEDRISLRALGPSEDSGPRERVDVSLLSAAP